ncbi:hypothetical protein M406DRAFT_261797, partial [Cryphonectria parasitica EP155]
MPTPSPKPPTITIPSFSSSPSSSSSLHKAPALPKLRDSCRSCATAKLKCSKEKPTCARCAKRGRLCEYLVSRR